MYSILSRVAASSRRIVVTTSDEFFGLQIARRLGDAADVRDYVTAGSHTSAAGLLAAYRVIKATPLHTAEVNGPRFRAAVKTLAHRPLPDSHATLIALRVSRGRIAAAVFTGLRLEYVQVRELASVGYKAHLSAITFVRGITDRYPGCTLAIEEHHAKGESRSAELTRVIVSSANDFKIPLSIHSQSALYEAYAEPACVSRAQFRDVVAGIFPALALRFRHRLVYDAVGLALYVQVWRLLNQEERVTV
jgi:hypothetical protein